MPKKRSKKIKIDNLIIFVLTLILIIMISVLLYKHFKKQEEIKIKKIYMNNSNIIIRLDKDVECKINDDKKWISSKNKECVFDFVEKVEKIYTRTKNGNVIMHKADETFGIVNAVNVIDTIYLIQGETEKLEYSVDSKGKVDKTARLTSSNESIVSIDGETLKAVESGETTVKLTISNIEKEIKVYVTNMLVLKPANFNYNKPYLSCGKYSESDNDLIDKVLEYKINKAGYLTRAGVVEAGRFITLNFPYRINYFSENGRMADWPKADGEGRYYHKGLYLNSSRFDRLNKDYIKNGPNPWGCPIYSNPAGGDRANGLDCSGLISWIIYQGGYDPSDMGAGIEGGRKDFTDLGEKQKIDEAVSKKTLKVGDLLSGDGETSGAYRGGHIAMLIGIHDGYYYVAEELWGKPSLSHGAVAQRYTESEFKYYFYWRIDMDEFYGEDGNLTDYWL